MIKIDITDIQQHIGQAIGLSKWLDINQSRVNKFAESTGDFQWVHVDEERAKTDLPTGRTIVHNFLLLSLIPQLFDQIVTITGLKYGMNLGAENIKFYRPLTTGSKIRARLELLKLDHKNQTHKKQNGQIATFRITLEENGNDRPVLNMDLQLLFVAAQNNVKRTDTQSISADHHQPVAFGL